MIAVPTLTLVAELRVAVAEPIAVGETPNGLRRIVPILGGEVVGPKLFGRVLPGGADYQLIRADGYSMLDARYLIEATDGALIYVVNNAVRFGAPEVMAKLTRGEPVDPALIYFRSVPRFETAAPAHQWMTQPIFLGSGVRRPDRVEIAIYEVG
jgi:hypothetical protein